MGGSLRRKNLAGGEKSEDLRNWGRGKDELPEKQPAGTLSVILLSERNFEHYMSDKRDNR